MVLESLKFSIQSPDESIPEVFHRVRAGSSKKAKPTIRHIVGVHILPSSGFLDTSAIFNGVGTGAKKINSSRSIMNS